MPRNGVVASGLAAILMLALLEATKAAPHPHGDAADCLVSARDQRVSLSSARWPSGLAFAYYLRY